MWPRSICRPDQDVEPQVTDPEQSLARQISVTAKRTRAWADSVFAEHGASLVTWIVLRHALHADPPGFSQRQLADDMAIGGPALVPQLDRLEREGLVQRRPDPDDRRVTRVSITPEGRRRHDELAVVAAEIDADLRSLLTPDEADAVYAALARIERHFSPGARSETV
jgi:MarR family transcriptional regulator for hemolysin